MAKCCNNAKNRLLSQTPENSANIRVNHQRINRIEQRILNFLL